MAMNIKEILCDSLLKLSETTSLENITIKQLLDDTHISRQTFYNHFLDKNDLIQYIYNYRINANFNDPKSMQSFYDSLVCSYNNMIKYHSFLKQACKMEGQNCLKDYILKHCEEFDLAYHQSLYGSKPMPEALRFATKYHANASSNMTLSWILSDMPVSSEDLASLIVQMRSLGMAELFKNGKSNPYQ